MKQFFSINVGTISVNNTYYGNKRFGKTKGAQDWFHTVFYNLSLPGHKESLAALREAHDPKTQGYRMDITIGVPRETLYNKAGQLSSRTMDLSNVEKSIVDAFFLPSNYGPDVPYQCENLNIDDKYLVALSSRKIATSQAYIQVELQLVPLP